MNTKNNWILKDKTFDKSKWMQIPRDVVAGHGVIKQIPDIITDLGINGNILVLSGPNTMKTTGARVIEYLKERTVYSSEVGKITYDEVRRIEEYAKDKEIKLIAAVGGGRVIDTAKVVSYNLDIQFISIPTAASHDGIASSRASISTDNGSVSVAAHPPIAIIADTEILSKAPRRLMASGYADMIANYTAILDWRLSIDKNGEKGSEYAETLSLITSTLMVKNADKIKEFDENAAWIVVKALFASGIAMSIAGSSRPASGGEHKFAHMLEIIAPGKALHGEACGIGSIISMYLHGGEWRRIRNALKIIGAPTKPTDLGLADDDVIEAIMRAHEIRPERYTIFDEDITLDKARHALEILYEE